MYQHVRSMSTLMRGQVYVDGEFSSPIRTARAGGCAVVHATKRRGNAPCRFADWMGCATTPPRWWKLAPETSSTPRSCRSFFSILRRRLRPLRQSPHHPGRRLRLRWSIDLSKCRAHAPRVRRYDRWCCCRTSEFDHELPTRRLNVAGGRGCAACCSYCSVLSSSSCLFFPSSDKTVNKRDLSCGPPPSKLPAKPFALRMDATSFCCSCCCFEGISVVFAPRRAHCCF